MMVLSSRHPAHPSRPKNLRLPVKRCAPPLLSTSLRADLKTPNQLWGRRCLQRIRRQTSVTYVSARLHRTPRSLHRSLDVRPPVAPCKLKSTKASKDSHTPVNFGLFIVARINENSDVLGREGHVAIHHPAKAASFTTFPDPVPPSSPAFSPESNQQG